MAVLYLLSYFRTQTKGTVFSGMCHSVTEGKGKEVGRNIQHLLDLCFELL